MFYHHTANYVGFSSGSNKKTTYLQKMEEQEILKKLPEIFLYM